MRPAPLSRGLLRLSRCRFQARQKEFAEFGYYSVEVFEPALEEGAAASKAVVKKRHKATDVEGEEEKIKTSRIDKRGGKRMNREEGEEDKAAKHASKRQLEPLRPSDDKENVERQKPRIPPLKRGNKSQRPSELPPKSRPKSPFR